MKKTNEFKIFWSIAGALVATSIVQWPPSYPMASDMDIAFVVSKLVKWVMISSAMISVFVFNDGMSSQQRFNFAIAIIRITAASLAKT
jgi:hypothetical protein